MSTLAKIEKQKKTVWKQMKSVGLADHEYTNIYPFPS